MGFLSAALGAVGIASSLFNSNKQSNASDRATDAQERAAQESIAFQRETRDLARADLNPFVEAGTNALLGLSQEAGNTSFFDDDFFSALNSRALPAITESRAAQGLFDSQGTRNALADRLSQNALLAGPQLQQQRFNQLSGLTQLGQNSAAGQANIAQNTGSGISNTLLGIGDVQAQNQFNQANAFTGALNNVSSILGSGAFSFKNATPNTNAFNQFNLPVVGGAR